MSDRQAMASVADGQIPPSPPPATSTGAIGWLRENLFSSPVNSILTLASLALIFWVVPGILEWAFLDAVWYAQSLDECRAVNADGACWAVIVQRFDQFIYGFYPEPLRWRPNLAFVLLVVSVAYVLFDRMPFRPAGLVLAAVYPVVAYFLIWGGTIWAPIFILLTAPIAYGVFRVTSRFIDPLFAVAAAGAAAVLWLLFVVGPADSAITRAIGDARYEDRVAELEVLQTRQGDIETEVAEFYAADLKNIADEDARAARLADLVEERHAEIEALLADLGRLQTNLQRIEELRAEALALRAAAPVDFRDIANRAELQVANPPAEAAERLKQAISMEEEATSLELRIDDVYEEIGRVGLQPVGSRSLGGFLLATIIGVAGITLSLPIGILLALGRRSGMIFIKSLSVMFIEFIRGVPLITLLFVANSVLAYFFPPGSNLDLILRVVIMVTMFASAYMAEVIRGGLAALPAGQYEAGDSLGLDYWKSMRLIILPQALKISIPNIVSTFIGLFKDTTLVVVIGLLDPIGLINAIRSDSAWNGIVWEFYVFVGLFFWVICFCMSRYSQYLERKLATDRR
ncbi:MAG TPA: ABC transporter permease subunit [Paracoccaceae bacterium]|nr:ABC transporter permease subunit [Paracoccaceae bacterium]